MWDFQLYDFAGIIRKTRTVMECLHRFCRECIDKSMRMGNNECPACRTHCASRRSLRDDPNYDALIAALYPNIDKYEEEELAFHEEERTRNKQYIACQTFIQAKEIELLAPKRVFQFVNDQSNTQTSTAMENPDLMSLMINSCRGNMQILKAEETLAGMKASCTSIEDQLEKAGLGSSTPETGRGKSKLSKRITHGFYMVKGKSKHAMEDYVVSEFKRIKDNELGLFAIFDGHLGHNVANYLQTHLFVNILNEPDFLTQTKDAIKRAYCKTDDAILDQVISLGKGGSTAVTAILINGQKLVVANVGDSRAVICKNGVVSQLSIDHEPSKEKPKIESRGGFVSNIPGDVPRVDGQLAVARAFGDKSLKIHLSSEPDVEEVMIGEDTEFIILASDGIWKVMTNQEAVDSIKNIKDAQSAAKHLIEEALSKKSKDDISCIVVKFH